MPLTLLLAENGARLLAENGDRLATEAAGPMARLDEFYAAIATWVADATGHPCFVMYATGRPVEPYCVIEPRWYSEPDVGGQVTGMPTAYSLAFHANSYGRRTTDALWLDELIYKVIVDDPIPTLGVEVLFREGDSTPVLSFTETGHMLSKHMYRLTYR